MRSGAPGPGPVILSPVSVSGHADPSPAPQGFDQTTCETPWLLCLGGGAPPTRPEKVSSAGQAPQTPGDTRGHPERSSGRGGPGSGVASRRSGASALPLTCGFGRPHDF